jgi:hypothetical protein
MIALKVADRIDALSGLLRRPHTQASDLIWAEFSTAVNLVCAQFQRFPGLRTTAEFG